MKSTSLRLVGAALSFGIGCFISSASFAQSSFPQLGDKMCPFGFQSKNGMCYTNSNDRIGMQKVGSCPKGWREGPYYCTKEVKKDQAPSGGSGGGSSSAADPDKTHYGKPVVKRITKRDELDFCPTGYFTSNARRGECITDKAEAPNVAAKQGECPAGTTEEQGQYCTGSTSLTAEQMHSFFVMDFNAQYFKRKNAGIETVRANHEPALYVRARDAAKANPAASAAPAPAVVSTTSPASNQSDTGTNASAPASPSTGVEEAAKAIGATVLKDLFKR
jgi:hypothetical protein